jgi:hypothetical protein
MRSRKREQLLGLLLGTSFYLLDKLRDRLPDSVEIKDRAWETYKTASDRLGHAANILRGREESRIFGKVGALLIGMGVGVGIGLLVAPASGGETRADLAGKVSDFGDKVREATGKKPQSATGT